MSVDSYWCMMVLTGVCGCLRVSEGAFRCLRVPIGV